MENASIESETQTQETSRYTNARGRDGVDDTWDIYDPYGKVVLCIRFWDDADDDDEAAITEARAKLIVDTLNLGYWW